MGTLCIQLFSFQIRINRFLALCVSLKTLKTKAFTARFSAICICFSLFRISEYLCSPFSGPPTPFCICSLSLSLYLSFWVSSVSVFSASVFDLLFIAGWLNLGVNIQIFELLATHWLDIKILTDNRSLRTLKGLLIKFSKSLMHFYVTSSFYTCRGKLVVPTQIYLGSYMGTHIYT